MPPARSTAHYTTARDADALPFRTDGNPRIMMTGTELLLSSSAALLIGILIGSVGIGGVLMVPWLTQAIGLPVREAVAIAMLSFVATGIAALVISARSLRDPATMRWPMVLATAPGALANSTSAPSPISRTIRPPWRITVGSNSAVKSALTRA
ncbi:MAG: hypothetical protein EHM83_09495 [Burkholderiales bacterium]|nr:MAG: hypothetical protein EHM83_09495 [Burkholderiales bacterium]